MTRPPRPDRFERIVGVTGFEPRVALDLLPYVLPVGSTNGTSLRPWWPVRNTVHCGQGMRLLAMHSRRQAPAIDRDSFLSPLSVRGWVPHFAAGVLCSCA
jgi:hypothetical protein